MTNILKKRQGNAEHDINFKQLVVVAQSGEEVCPPLVL